MLSGCLVPCAVTEAWEGGSPGKTCWLMSDLLWRGTVEKMLEFSWVSTWATLKTNLQLPANARHSRWLLQHQTATAAWLLAFVYHRSSEWLEPLFPFSPSSWGTRAIQVLMSQGLHPMPFPKQSFLISLVLGDVCVYLPPKLCGYKCSVLHTCIDAYATFCFNHSSVDRIKYLLRKISSYLWATCFSESHKQNRCLTNSLGVNEGLYWICIRLSTRLWG